MEIKSFREYITEASTLEDQKKMMKEMDKEFKGWKAFNNAPEDEKGSTKFYKKLVDVAKIADNYGLNEFKKALKEIKDSKLSNNDKQYVAKALYQWF